MSSTCSKDSITSTSSKQINDEDNDNFIALENKFNEKELAEFITKIYDESKVNKDKDTNQARSASHDAGKKNNHLSTTKNEEASLGEELKQICEKTGKEINPQKSALIFHRLAQIYKERSPDKLSLIKSAALYNAALIRSPGRKESEESLHRLCCHILKQAGAKIADANLVEKANEIKKNVVDMRNSVNEKLKIITQIAGYSGEKISAKDQETQRTHSIKLIQNELYSSYSSLMDDISGYCNHVMGEPPCKFSVVGMGSLARQELSPFSDFEHMILLEDIDDKDSSYEKKLEYFRWFSTIFHVIVINLQETILPSVDIVCLRNTSSNPANGYWFYDNVATRGISFDGLLPWANKNPLGRQEFTEKKQFKTELIKPVSKMLHYLSNEEDLKQGYHLADLLTKVCFVHGDKELFEIFENKMYKLLEINNSDAIIHKLEGQLNEDFQNFAVRSIMLQLRLNKSINIKKVVYRSTTLFISALGRIYKIRKNSCFDIIEKLFDENLISKNSKLKLDYAIALACEVRLRWYMQRGRQDDVIESQSDQSSIIQTFTSLLGLENTINYFQIAYSLQCDISKRFNLKKMHFHSDPQLLNHKIIFGLNCKDETIMTMTSQKNNAYNQRFLDFDECLSQLEQNIEIKKENENKNFFDKRLKAAENYKEIGDKCKDQRRWDDAMEFFQMCICIIKELDNADQSTQLNKMHRYCLRQTGYCLYCSYKFNDAINKYKESILVCENLPQDNNCYRWVAKCLRWIGLNFYEQFKEIEGKKYLEQSLLVFQSTSIDIDCDKQISRVLQDLVRCFADMNQNEAGQKYYYERWMHFEKQNSLNNKSQSRDDDAGSLYNKGTTLYRIKKYAEALENFKKCLDLVERVSIDKQKDSDIANSLYWIGRCLHGLNKYDEALESFKKSVDIFECVSIDKQKDSFIASSLYWIGRCLYDLNKHDEAMESFKKSLDIRERASIDKQKNSDIADSLYWIGRYLHDINEYDEALENFKKCLDIFECVSIDKQKDRDIANSLYWIGRCLHGLNKYDEALESFKKSLNIRECVSIDKQKDSKNADSLHWIGRCLYDLNKYDEALESFKKSLNIRKCASIDQQKGSNIADSLHWIDQCLHGLNKYDEALESFKKCLNNLEQVSTDIGADQDIAETLDKVGDCLVQIKRKNEAELYHKRAKQIKINRTNQK